MQLVTTSSYIQVLYCGNVISQACQNFVAGVCMLLIRKDISSMATYFTQHQLFAVAINPAQVTSAQFGQTVLQLKFKIS